MKIVLAEIKHNENNHSDIDLQFKEVEFDGKLETLSKILCLTEYRPEESYDDGSGGGCSESMIKVCKNHTEISIPDEHIYPTAFILDGKKYSGDRTIAFIGIEQLLGNAEIYTLDYVMKNIVYPDYSKD